MNPMGHIFTAIGSTTNQVRDIPIDLVGKTIYYNAEEHNWKIMELKEMVES